MTKVIFAVDAGLVINPRGLEAQMQGGINDGIAQALTSSMHLRDGHFLEASWDNYFYTRQWNTPPEVEVIVMPIRRAACRAEPARPVSRPAWPRSRAPTPGPPAGCRRTFPINHDDPLAFKVKPYVPPDPAVADQRPQADLLRSERCPSRPSSSTASR